MEKMPQNRYGSTQALIDDLVEFLSTCVSINHNARLVMFLREVSVITDAEADEILEAAGSRAAKKRDNDRSLVRHIGLAMALMLVGITATGSAIQTLAGSARARPDDEQGSAGVLTRDRAGFLQLVVDPWAEVHVDGQLLTVTPTAEHFMLSPGRHFVKLSHPQFQAVTREVDIERGKLARLKVTLSSPAPKLGSAK
jgi:serine/threonine-protein kinase